jgi:AraC-like DNA-binding protein
MQAGSGRTPNNDERTLRLFSAHDRLLVAHSSPERLREIARKAGFSPYHFVRLFRTTFGQTPHRVSIASRLRHAQALLLESELPITEICLECGYESLGSFSHLFRREFGQSPSAFRARRRFWPVNITFFQKVIPFCLLDGFR